MATNYQITPLDGFEPEIGRWLAALEQVRGITVRAAEGLDQRTLDWEGPDGRDNAIGSLLYHIALVEMSWLYMDIFEQELPPHVEADFPWPMSDGARLTRVPGIPLDEHLARLARSRAIFLDALREMSLDDWRRMRAPGDVDYSVSPEWAVFHLIEHEAGHAYQIRNIRSRAARLLARPASAGGIPEAVPDGSLA